MGTVDGSVSGDSSLKCPLSTRHLLAMSLYVNERLGSHRLREETPLTTSWMLTSVLSRLLEELIAIDCFSCAVPMNQEPEYNDSDIHASLLEPRSSGRHPNRRTQSSDTNVVPICTRADISVPFWSEDETKELISKHGRALVYAVNNNGAPLLCDAIVQQQLDSAKLLLENASEHKLLINLSTGRCPTLDWAIEKRCQDVAKFILHYVADQKLPVEESCSILTNYLFPLMEEFPIMISGYLENDRFSFEYGRFSVPHSLFAKSGKCPIAMTTDACIDSWTGFDDKWTKDFWVRNCEEHAEDLRKTSDFEVRVAAKFLCINQHVIRLNASDDTVGVNCEPRMSYLWQHVLRLLATSKVPVAIFNSESLTYFTNWMFYSLCARFWWLVALDVLTAVFFSAFAAMYGFNKDEPHALHRLASHLLIIASCVLPLIALAIRHSRIKVLSILITLAITVRVFQSDTHEPWSAFLTSIECVLCWMLVVEALLPFDRIGPFVSMVKYSFKAVIPFSILAGFVLCGFSFAVRVVFKYEEDTETEKGSGNVDVPGNSTENSAVACPGNCEDSTLEIGTIPHVMKILFHAAIGNFEESMFQPPGDSDFIGIWRSLLFNIFVFVGGIVLISLLVAILSDTFDMVRLTEKMELVKCRAEMAGSALFFVVRRIVAVEERITQQLHRRRKETRCLDPEGSFWRSLAELPGLVALRVNNMFHRLYSVKPVHRKQYFHYLVRQKMAGEEDATVWEGRMIQFEKSMKKEFCHRFNSLEERMKALRDSYSGAKRHSDGMPSSQAEEAASTNARIEKVEEELRDINDKLERILSLTTRTAA